MNSRALIAAIVAIVFCAGPALLVAQPPPDPNEWSDITYIQGRYSRLYFDYKQPDGAGTAGTFYFLNDWAVNHEDGCINGGIVCDSIAGTADSCEANLYYFRRESDGPNGQLYTITIYKNNATISPPLPDIADLVGKFSWNPSPNEALEHTIWECSFRTLPIVLVQFEGHDPAVAVPVYPPGQPSPFTSGPSTYPHLVDGLFANLEGPDVACDPPRSFQAPASLPKDPGIPPLTIILHDGGGGGVDVVPQYTQIPTLSEWGLITFVVLLAGWMTFVVVRRWRRPHATA